jgi:2Fe-2S ferredoxin
MTRKFIYFLPTRKPCEIKASESVLEVALKNGIEISHSCGAMGTCTTCRVFVEESQGPLPERNELEQEMADSRGFKENERLSCQLPPVDGLVLRIPDTLGEDDFT